MTASTYTAGTDFPTGSIKGWVAILVGMWAAIILGLSLLAAHWSHSNAEFAARGVTVQGTTLDYKGGGRSDYQAQVRFDTPGGVRTAWIRGISPTDVPVNSKVQVVYLPGADDVRYPPYARDTYNPGSLVSFGGVFATIAFGAIIAHQVGEYRTGQAALRRR